MCPYRTVQGARPGGPAADSSSSPWARCSRHRHLGMVLPPATPAATAPRPAAGSLWAEEKRWLTSRGPCEAGDHAGAGLAPGISPQEGPELAADMLSPPKTQLL